MLYQYQYNPNIYTDQYMMYFMANQLQDPFGLNKLQLNLLDPLNPLSPLNPLNQLATTLLNPTPSPLLNNLLAPTLPPMNFINTPMSTVSTFEMGQRSVIPLGLEQLFKPMPNPTFPTLINQGSTDLGSMGFQIKRKLNSK